jgi:uridine kinase
MTTTSPSQLVAIVGGSGAGKGWLVDRLRERLGDRACHLQLDNFYRDRSHLPFRQRELLNFDEPEAIDWDAAERVLHDCRAGRATYVPRYDFATYSRVAPEPALWQPQPVVLVDGLWLLSLPRIRALFDLKIFLDVPVELRCQRRLERDVIERGYTAEAIRRQLQTAVLPMHDRHVEPQKTWADAILSYPIVEHQIAELVERIDHGHAAELVAETAS